MSIPVIVINAAYIALLGSTFTRTLNWLRALLICGSVMFVTYGLIEGIRSMVVWNLITGTLHTTRIVKDLTARRSVKLSAEEAVIRDQSFPGLDDFDFHALWGLGRAYNADNTVFIEEGSQPEHVMLLVTGQVHVERDGSVISKLGRGSLVGEMSFASGEAANATVTADGPVTMHGWGQRDLAMLAQLNPASSRAFDALLARDLAAKAGR